MRSPGRFSRPALTRRDVVALVVVLVLGAVLIILLLPPIHNHTDRRRVATEAILHVLDTGLEQFHASTGLTNSFPDSRLRPDPIADFPGGTGENQLSGAHWLFRALAGSDLKGVEKGARSLGTASNPPLRMADLDSKERFGPYVDIQKIEFSPDNDRKLAHAGDFAPTGRSVFLDAYGRPILYYRANSRGRQPFSRRGTTQPASGGEELGIYNHEDNARITGSDNRAGWAFDKNTTGKPIHPLGVFGSSDTGHVVGGPTPNNGRYSFSSYLHDRTRSGNVRPVNIERFILISAGKDGLYGTADDITNFPLPWQQSAQRRSPNAPHNSP